MGIPVKAIDYVEIDEAAVRSYNAMFENDLPYKTQSVVGWNLKPDILIHGSPCTQISAAGYISPAKNPKGFKEGTGTESSLMWETVHIIQSMGMWRPRIVIWENVKNVRGKQMIQDYNKYIEEMESLGYTNSYECLDARDFGIPQGRKRVFTISCLNGEKFDFDKLRKTQMRPLSEFLESSVSDIYTVTQTSVYKGYKQDKIEMRGDRAEMSDFPLYLNTVAGGLDCRDQTIGGFSFVVKIYAVPVVEIIG